MGPPRRRGGRPHRAHGQFWRCDGLQWGRPVVEAEGWSGCPSTPSCAPTSSFNGAAPSSRRKGANIAAGDALVSWLQWGRPVVEAEGRAWGYDGRVTRRQGRLQWGRVVEAEGRCLRLDPVKSPRGGLQWGRPVVEAEGTCASEAPAPPRRGFNGAAPSSRRKALHSATRSPSGGSFNGAAPSSRRKEEARPSVRRHEGGLQWGRPVVEAEGAAAPRCRLAPPSASMGPPRRRGGRSGAR